MYSVKPLGPVKELEEVARWVLGELQSIQSTLEVNVHDFVRLVPHNVSPAKPREGMVVLADGTNWNPGSGRGVYWYDTVSSTWKFLG